MLIMSVQLSKMLSNFLDLSFLNCVSVSSVIDTHPNRNSVL